MNRTVGATLAAAVLVALALAAVATRSQADPPSIVHADAALVFSGDVDYLRVKQAASLYRSGAVKQLLLTGAGAGGDSAEAMWAVAIAEGVPGEAILLERYSTTTHENVQFAAPIVRERGWTRVAAVTSRSHLPRAYATAAHALPEVAWVPVAVPDAGPPGRVWREHVEERVKFLWYILRGWA
jgi:uncharacterized SAM-binding protein YcdF (DUF218 family)